MGPVTPLLAVLRQIKKRDAKLKFAWAGTADGPERIVIEKERIPFYVVPTAKIARYPSVTWLTYPFDYYKAKQAARVIIESVKPSLVVSAGGFTAVPVMLEASLRGIPCVIHQLDVEPGLSNKRVAAQAKFITTSFAYPASPFGKASHRVATPCRFAGVKLPDRESAAKRLGVDPSRKIVFVFGGGTGALAINKAVEVVLTELTKEHSLIHSTGKGKSISSRSRNYHHFDVMDERQMLDAYAVSDLVVARAGMGTLSELAALSKPAIIIPIPNTHQEENAKMLEEGVEIVEQSGSDFPERLKTEIRRLLKEEKSRTSLGKKLHGLLPTDDGSELAEKWIKLLT